MLKAGSIFFYWVLISILSILGPAAFAQAPAGGGLGNQPKKDTSLNKTNNNKWKNEDARITYQQLNSEKIHRLDSGIHSFQHLSYLDTWTRDLGNIGGPATNLLFTPDDHFGPTLGYHVFDACAYNIDSLKYFNTNRPYSDFTYRLGSKLEQYVGIMHTQNIRPNWNVAVEYHKTTSAGYYKIDRNNNDNAYLTSNYRSLDKHYQLFFGLVYNKEQHDENGGLSNPGELDSVDASGAKIYSDRRTIDVVNQNDAYSLTRSSVYNNMRQCTFLLQHSYAWGTSDTTYNEDSTQYSYKLAPRFSLSHKLELSTEKHTYNDLIPDSARYTSLFQQGFTNSGTGYYTAGEDSVFAQQKWFWVDNKFLFNGFIGKADDHTRFSAGVGTRYDLFTTTPAATLYTDSLPKLVKYAGQDQVSMINNYAEASIVKEAMKPGQWAYTAHAQMFVTGPDAGNFLLNASLGKELKKDIGFLEAGFQQQVNAVPYSYTYYANAWANDTFHLSHETINRLEVRLVLPRWHAYAGMRNYLIANYIYINQNLVPGQYTIPISMQQLWVRKVFHAGRFMLDNDFAIQQTPASAPVNVPFLMGHHQICYENALFKKDMTTY